MSDCMIPRAADRHRKLLEAINRAKGGVYDVNAGGPVNLPKPRIIDAVWTDGYGRTHHVVGRERLTAAEDEIASLTAERDEALARVEKLESQRTTWRHLYEGAAESRDEGYRLAEEVAAQLPTPDATNPAHLRWAADMIELSRPGGDLACRARQRNVLADDLRAGASRLEATQQQDDAEKALRDEVEKAVAESTDLAIDLIHSFAHLTDVDAAKASMRPAIRDAVDAALADLRGGDEQ